MKIAVLPRGGGKTTKMLQWMREAPEGEHRVVLCYSAGEAMRLYRENTDLESWQFVSSSDLRAGAWSGVLHGRGGRISLGIDNLDILLRNMAGGWPVDAVTMTGVEW